MPESPFFRHPTPGRLLLAGSLALSLGGCAALYPPLSLLDTAIIGGAATAVSLNVVTAPGTASDTVSHLSQPLSAVCIEYNPQVQASDIVPTLQIALRENRVESRVYESPDGLVQCPIWLRYTAQIDWDTLPFSSDYKAYISTATLTLRTGSGALLSSSHYRIDPSKRSKWASTRDKLSPVVNALLGSATQPAPTATPTAPASPARLASRGIR